MLFQHSGIVAEIINARTDVHWHLHVVGSIETAVFNAIVLIYLCSSNEILLYKMSDYIKKKKSKHNFDPKIILKCK